MRSAPDTPIALLNMCSSASCKVTTQLNVELIDDFVDKAQDVHNYNPWLNYALHFIDIGKWVFTIDYLTY
eukprot:8988971-Ditylum_brightwellii.AAC.1